MPEKIRRVRRKRRSRSLPGVESFSSLRLHLPPVRVAVYVAAAALVLLLIVFFGTYGSKLYGSWHESRLLKRATAMLEKKDFSAASQSAKKVLERHRDSLPAFYILAEATEKQNSEETVSWRAQIARLEPNNLDSQLNLASAALRFGQIDLARKTLERIAPVAGDQAAYHVIAGWLARAEGNTPEQEQQFADAVKRDPKNDLGLLMQWMDDNGLASEVIKWMHKLPGEMTAKPPPAMAIAEAFAELKNWSRLRRWTRSGSWGDRDYLRLAYQAFAARQSRQSSADAESDTLWRAAEHAANDEPDQELWLARLASKWGLSIEAEQLWLRLA